MMLQKVNTIFKYKEEINKEKTHKQAHQGPKKYYIGPIKNIRAYKKYYIGQGQRNFYQASILIAFVNGINLT